MATSTPIATPTPAATSTPVPVLSATLDIRLLNGEGEIHLDGELVRPGQFTLPVGTHRVATLREGVVLEDREVTLEPDEIEVVTMVLPPPRPGLAVVVENHSDARPQSGLQEANVVYEMLAEGGISRFLALYLDGDAKVVGPVRSLRHYFAFLAAEYQADVVHIGASPQGFAWRDAMRIGKLDESAGDPGVWRVRGRFAPHNAYTNTEVDRDLLLARGYQHGAEWGPLRISKALEPLGDSAASIGLTFAPSPYRVHYEWDEERGAYLRFMEGAPHRDAESGQQITVGSVVVQFARVDPIRGDNQGRVDIGLSEEEGRLLVFSQGRVREGTWQKGLPHEPTEWLDSEGNDILLPPSNVWVEIVPLTAVVN